MGIFKQEEEQCHKQSVLFESRKGYVTFCEGCNTFHIAYGTVAFNQAESSFTSLMSILELYYKEYIDKVDPKQRCIYIDTPFNGFKLLFSINEIEEFKDILNQAHLIFEARRIING